MDISLQKLHNQLDNIPENFYPQVNEFFESLKKQSEKNTLTTAQKKVLDERLRDAENDENMKPVADLLQFIDDL